MLKQLAHLPEPVAKTIAAFYRRQRFYEFLRSLVTPLLFYAVLALVAIHLDRFLFLSPSSRVWISVVTHGACIAALAVPLGVFFWRRRTASRIAYDLERMLPASVQERLVTLTDIMSRPADARAADPQVHAAMLGQLTNETLALCERTPHAGRLARDRALRCGFIVLTILAIVWAGFILLPRYEFGLMLKRLTFPRMNLPKPSFVQLKVTPENAVVARRGEVVLQVEVVGDIPAWLRKPMSWLGADSSVCLMAKATGRVDRLAFTADARPMSRVQRRLFVASLSDLQESLSFRVRCGDAETDVRYVKVVPQPRIMNAVVQVEAPAYTGIKTMVYTNLIDPIAVFPASRVQLRFASDQKPLKRARLVNLQTGDTLKELVPDVKTGEYGYPFDMSGPVEMEIVIVNEMGFENDERVQISLALREDQPPIVRLEYPVGEVTVVQGELVPMHMDLSDDLGLVEAGIRFKINDSDSLRELPLTVDTNLLTQALSAEFDLEKAGVMPGDVVLVDVGAKDTAGNYGNSTPVRIRVGALAGNENEHRRLVALRLATQALAAFAPFADAPGGWVPNEEAYGKVVEESKRGAIELDERPALESLLRLIEREQHFTDSAASAGDLRRLRGVLAAIANPPSSLRNSSDGSKEARKAVLTQLTNSILPGLRIERTGRDIARRALNLRGEVESMTAPSGSGERRTAAAFDRRANLLAEALEETSAEFIKLVGMASQVKKEDVLAFSQKINRATRDLKQGGANRLAAGDALCEQIDGWIGLLLPALPVWNEQHRAARAELRAAYDRLRKPIADAAMRGADADAIRWTAADARMIERNPYAGLGERLASISSGGAETASASVAAALAGEAVLYSRLAMEDEYAEWLESPRLRPSERRLAEALRALDLAADDTSRAAAAARLKTLDLQDVLATAAGGVAAATPVGLYSFLPALSGTVGSLQGSHEKGIERLLADAQRLQGMVRVDGEEGGSVDVAAILNSVQAGLAGLEAETDRILFRMHLDAAYSDPQQEGAERLALIILALRDVVSRYQAVVPPLVDRMRAGIGKRGEREASLATQNLQELSRSVGALTGGLSKVLRQLRGEKMPDDVKESASVREMRFYLASARKLADAKDAEEMARKFFAGQPAAAAMVLGRQMPALAEMRACVRRADETLKTQQPSSAEFRDPMRQAAQLVAGFQQALARFAFLDPDGAVQGMAGGIRKRIDSLAASGADNKLEKTKLMVNELLRQAQELESQAKEAIARSSPATPVGWQGGPAGIWSSASRRDAEHSRRRLIRQFERARREAALGFDGLLTQKDKGRQALPDQPLEGALFAWRAMHSSLGGAKYIKIQGSTEVTDEKNPLPKWLQEQVEQSKKGMRSLEGHTAREATLNWFDSVLGWIRRGQ